MPSTFRIGAISAALAAALAGFSGAASAQTYKIGAALGLTGYAATNDRAWRDGMELAINMINAKGGLLGKKIELIAEDNRSEPQEAVVVYRKMMSNDKVQIFDSGCVSAGNFAAAGAVIREQIPLVLCSILPGRPEEQKWSFSTLPPPRYEIEARYKYLKEHTDIRKVGLLHDPTPYALMMTDLAVKLASDYGLEIASNESYKPDDADVSVQIGRINAAGGGAIIKMGQGGSTVTLAKNVKQLGLDKMLVLGGLDDGSVFKQSADALGERFLFVATGVQIPESIPAGAAREQADQFIKVWREKYGDRDTNSGARGWDSILIIAKAAEIGKSLEGPAMRDALEKVTGFQGSVTVYNFSADQHVGITANPFTVGVVRGDKFVPK